jgi:hypothetical protein
MNPKFIDMNRETAKEILSVFLLFFLLFSYSCSKRSGDVNSSGNKKTIAGEWKWINSISGWGSIKTAVADTIVILTLNNDSSYSVSLNNQVKYSGNFSSSIITGSDSLLVLQFDRNMEVSQLRIPMMQSVVYFNNDTCRLYDYAFADGYSHLYYRK